MRPAIDPQDAQQVAMIESLAMAKKWARYAIDNHRDGQPWHACAQLSHEYHRHALLVAFGHKSTGH